MADQSTDNKIITVRTLSTFYNKLKADTFYPQDTVDRLLQTKADLEGSINNLFKSNRLFLYSAVDPNHNKWISMFCEDVNGELRLKIDNSERNNIAVIPLTGTVLTNQDLNPDTVWTADNFDPDTKAGQKTIVPGTGPTALLNAQSFLNVIGYNLFYRLSPVENETVTIVAGTTARSLSVTNASNLQGGRIVYVSSDELAGINSPAGFYLTGAVTNNAATLQFIEAPSTRPLYYNVSDQKFCYWSGTWVEIAVSGGGGGGDIPEGYIPADDQDIINIFN